MAARPRTVIIADDHHLIIQSLRLLVEDTLGLQCIAAVYDGQSCIESASKYKPDLIILDLDLPGKRGEEAISLLKQVSDNSKILVITALTSSRLLRNVLEFGASGVVLKGSPLEEICDAVSQVLCGRQFLCTAVADILGAKSESDCKLESLTSRENEIFELLLQRTSISTISTRLSVSPKTVDNHKTRIMAKLDVHSQADLIAFAVRAGCQALILKSSLE